MRFYSTKDKKKLYPLEEAVLKGLPGDNGLFMPEFIPQLPKEFFKDLKNCSFPEIAFEIANAFLKNDVPHDVIKNIVSNAINFEAPVIRLDEKTFVLELFHGPTLAFKDFGARFMAQLMSYLVRNSNKKITILVATSGDTGGAVASGFYKTEGIEVIILYPSGKVSFLQEKQLTTLGENISAIEVDGTFDDCQRLVKEAFLDDDLKMKYNLASANSINIARLIPQCFYYVDAYRQLPEGNDIVFSVPSGNFGNITAGLIAKRMGLPVKHFIASVNSNDVFSKYLGSGKYEPLPSIQTISNAMDVGAPSNFARIMDLYDHSLEKLREDVSAYSFNDEQTIDAMQHIYKSYRYIIDPHGAVGYLGLKNYRQTNNNTRGIILETAHPSKFLDTVEEVLDIKVEVPQALKVLGNKGKKATALTATYEDFKAYLSAG